MQALALAIAVSIDTVFVSKSRYFSVRVSAKILLPVAYIREKHDNLNVQEFCKNCMQCCQCKMQS